MRRWWWRRAWVSVVVFWGLGLFGCSSDRADVGVAGQSEPSIDCRVTFAELPYAGEDGIEDYADGWPSFRVRSLGTGWVAIDVELRLLREGVEVGSSLIQGLLVPPEGRLWKPSAWRPSDFRGWTDRFHPSEVVEAKVVGCADVSGVRMERREVPLGDPAPFSGCEESIDFWMEVKNPAGVMVVPGRASESSDLDEQLLCGHNPDSPLRFENKALDAVSFHGSPAVIRSEPLHGSCPGVTITRRTQSGHLELIWRALVVEFRNDGKPVSGVVRIRELGERVPVMTVEDVWVPSGDSAWIAPSDPADPRGHLSFQSTTRLNTYPQEPKDVVVEFSQCSGLDRELVVERKRFDSSEIDAIVAFCEPGIGGVAIIDVDNDGPTAVPVVRSGMSQRMRTSLCETTQWESLSGGAWLQVERIVG